ncbi:hypothetical protein GCM10028816_01030 [Spirosoma lituiforme]
MKKIPTGRKLPVNMGITIAEGAVEAVTTITECFRFGYCRDGDEKNIPTAFRKKCIANGKPSCTFVRMT